MPRRVVEVSVDHVLVTQGDSLPTSLVPARRLASSSTNYAPCDASGNFADRPGRGDEGETFDMISATWGAGWVLLLAANGLLLWLLSLALIFGSTAGPVDDASEMTSLERLASRWSRIGGSVFAPRRPLTQPGAYTRRFVEVFGNLPEQMWRANRGAFLPARTLSQVAVLIGAAQLLLVFLVWAPRLDQAGWVYLGIAIFGIDLLSAIITLMAESGRWRRRAPFEAQLVHASLAVLMRSKKALPWSEGRSRLARVERVLSNRFHRAAGRPATQTHRDSLWQHQVSLWGKELAVADLQIRPPGGAYEILIAEQLEAAHRAVASPPKRWKRPAATPPPVLTGLDPQARAGWILLAVCSGGIVLFAALAAIDFMQSAHAPYPSLDELRSWAPVIGAVMTATSVVVGAVAWVVRKLASR